MAGKRVRKHIRNKRKNFIREKKIYCGKEWLEVDIVPVTNMPEAGKKKQALPVKNSSTLMIKEAKGVLCR